MKIRTALLAAALALGALLGGAGPAPAQADAQSTASQRLTITVRAHDYRNAGTTAPVYLTVFGDKGQLHVSFLNGLRAGETVARGPYQSPEIGRPNYLGLRLGGQDDWFPEFVHIYEATQGFEATCWLNETIRYGLTRYYACGAAG